MRGMAGLMTVLAFVAAAQAAAASGRFTPADPDFVVANISQSMPDAELRGLVAAWRAAPMGEASTVSLATAFIEHARRLREPMYFGRAEAVLEPVARRATASAAQRRLYAETLQYRHEFAAAETLLDTALMDAPRDTQARTLRASVRLVRGDFAGARSDCAQLFARGQIDATVGVACLADSYAGSGQFSQAQALLETYPLDGDSIDAAARAYLLAVRGELRERAADLGRALDDYRAALALAPTDDSIRAALADALAARGDTREAAALLDVERPSLALLVRRTALLQGAAREELHDRSIAWLALEGARGDAIHNREAAMLALADGRFRQALTAAQANFALQKELPDVRVLARASIAARDVTAQQSLRDWLRASGYRDAVTEIILARPAGS
jgi:thioredoxin-like negative regulator of GroEL